MWIIKKWQFENPGERDLSIRLHGLKTLTIVAWRKNVHIITVNLLSVYGLLASFIAGAVAF